MIGQFHSVSKPGKYMKTLYSNEEFKNKKIKILKELSDCVGSTMGPHGRTVILKDKDSRPIATKDGVTVAEFFNSKDPVEQSVIELLRQATQASGDKAGDGTTTCTVLTKNLFVESQKMVQKGFHAIHIQRAVEKITTDMEMILREKTFKHRSFEDLLLVAKTSANNDMEIAQIVADAVDSSGTSGAISISPSKTNRSQLEQIDGMHFDSGYISSYLLTDMQRNIAKVKSPVIFVTNEEINDPKDIHALVDYAVAVKHPLYIACAGISESVQLTLLSFREEQDFEFGVLVPLEYGKKRDDMLSDLALSVGARYHDKTLGDSLKAYRTPDEPHGNQGQCKFVEARRNSTVFYGGIGDSKKIEERVQFLMAEIKETEDDKDVVFLQKRLGRLTSSVCNIKIGGYTASEITEKIHRADDALKAVQNSIKEGLLYGGGLNYFKAAKSINLKNYSLFEKEVYKQVILPVSKSTCYQLLKNAGLSEDVFNHSKSLSSWDKSLDYETGKVKHVKNYKVIDSAMVVIQALKNAVSISNILLSADNIILENYE